MKSITLKTTITGMIGVALALVGCNFQSLPQGGATPTVEPQATATAPTPTETAVTPTPSATLPLVPQLESPTPTFSPAPPTETYTPSPTPGPIEHTIQADETLGYIIQLYGHRDFAVIDEILRLNPSIPNADRLPGPGTVILIPRPTATFTPEGFEETATARGDAPIVELPVETQIGQHTVREGETIIGIAGQYNTTLEILDQLNPELAFLNCDLTIASGGEGCNVPLSVGQVVNIPLPTPTPTLSPTPSGSETPTPTPTYAAPLVVFPPQDSKAPPAPITLQWVSIGVLPPNYYYLVEVEDTTSGQTYLEVTRDTSFTLDEALIPTDGETHDMRWRIRIAVTTEAGNFRPVSSEPPWRNFQWQSR